MVFVMLRIKPIFTIEGIVLFHEVFADILVLQKNGRFSFVYQGLGRFPDGLLEVDRRVSDDVAEHLTTDMHGA